MNQKIKKNIKLRDGETQFCKQNCVSPSHHLLQNQGFAWTFLVIILFLIALTFTLNSRYGFINAGTIETLSPYINRDLNEYNESDFVVEKPTPIIVTEPTPILPTNTSPTTTTTTTSPYFMR